MPVERFDSILKIHDCAYERDIYPWVQEHLVTPYWRFYWNPVPGGFLRVAGEVIELVPEFFYVIPGYLEFSTFAEKPFSQFYIHFNLSDRQERGREIYRLAADPTLVARIRAFEDRGESGTWLQLRMLTGISILSSALLMLPPELFRLPEQPDPRIGELCEWIGRHRGTPVTNADLAERIHLNRNSFIRLFRAETGESPQSYCRRKRIELACELLHFSDRSIEEIAEAAGFADRYHFSRVFARVIRSSPAAFRRAGRFSIRS